MNRHYFLPISRVLVEEIKVSLGFIFIPALIPVCLQGYYFNKAEDGSYFCCFYD